MSKDIEKTKSFGESCNAALDFISKLKREKKNKTGRLHSRPKKKGFEFFVTWKEKK